MLSTISSDPRWLSRIKSTPAAPFLDGFVTALQNVGYRNNTIQEFLRGAAHLSRWLEHRDQSMIESGSWEIERFKRHFSRCRCPGFKPTSPWHFRGAQPSSDISRISAWSRKLRLQRHRSRRYFPDFANGCASIGVPRMQRSRRTGESFWMWYGPSGMTRRDLMRMPFERLFWNGRHHTVEARQSRWSPRCAPLSATSSRRVFVPSVWMRLSRSLPDGSWPPCLATCRRQTSSAFWLPAIRAPQSAHAIERSCFSCPGWACGPAMSPICDGVMLTGTKPRCRSWASHNVPQGCRCLKKLATRSSIT